MRGTFTVDPMRCNYGPGTEAVRQILAEWMAIDWFEPPTARDAAVNAAARYEEHHARARAFLPERFAERVKIEIRRGTWLELSTLCGRVRASTSWDWKFGSLKPLARAHSRQLGLRMHELAPADTTRGEVPDPGDLFFSIGGQVIWQGLSPALAPGLSPAAQWYLSYAQMDALEALEWQLAERSDRLEENPFVPLIRGYATGFYPFVFGPDDMVLFALDG